MSTTRIAVRDGLDVTVFPTPDGGTALTLAGGTFPTGKIADARRTLATAGILEDPATLVPPRAAAATSAITIGLPCRVAVGVSAGNVQLAAAIDHAGGAALEHALATLGATA